MKMMVELGIVEANGKTFGSWYTSEVEVETSDCSEEELLVVAKNKWKESYPDIPLYCMWVHYCCEMSPEEKNQT